MQQIANTILMIRPINFRMNTETAVNNFFQKEIKNMLPTAMQEKALQEFDGLLAILQNVGVHVIVVNDTNTYDTPDALFPNNWISFHSNATAAIYPMFSENRRNERREDILETLEKEGFLIENVIDYSLAEEEDYFLEGTGSLVLDRKNRKAYAALSPRTDEDLCIEFCEDFEYTPVLFTANQTVKNNREAIYHTNVMLCIAETFAVVCLNAIDDKKERKQVIKQLKEDDRAIIAISQEQVHHFAGNMLQVLGANKKPYLVMSTTAFNSLTKVQKTQIETHCSILHANLNTIETCGGGSARCMLAEVFLPRI